MLICGSASLDKYAPCGPPREEGEGAVWGHYVFRYVGVRCAMDAACGANFYVGRYMVYGRHLREEG